MRGIPETVAKQTSTVLVPTDKQCFDILVVPSGSCYNDNTGDKEFIIL